VSAAALGPEQVDTSEPTEASAGPHTRAVGTPVVVRRNAGLAALVGAGASAIAIAYLWRATSTGTPLDWVLCLAMTGLAALYLAHLVDARTPLLIADELGVRIRLASQWRGLPWDGVGTVVVKRRQGPLRDGRLVFAPHSHAGSLGGLDARGRAAARLNQRLYGAPLAVPLGLGTRVSSRGSALVDDLAVLARGRAQIAEASRSAAPDPLEASRSAAPDPLEASRSAAPEPVVGPPARVRSNPGDGSPAPSPTPMTVPLRAARQGVSGRDGQEHDDKVRPTAALVDPVPPLVVDEFVVEPASDPVIGPELAAARIRVGLSVDELAERTRIRPHVIESIEVDDFAPCGGDFYARGHLRTLARVLGRDPGALLAQFDARYATAPVSARRVFEAELATGMTGSMRRTAGGPNWALLVGVVLLVVMTWGVVRLFAAEPVEQLRSPVTTLDGSAGVDTGPADTGTTVPATKPVTLTLAGVRASSQVVVRGPAGKVLWAGEVPLGGKRTLQVPPPVGVRAENAGALDASVDGQWQGPLGQLGAPGRRVFQRPTPR
jgi:cytoskeleton protein RodZ